MWTRREERREEERQEGRGEARGKRVKETIAYRGGEGGRDKARNARIRARRRLLSTRVILLRCTKRKRERGW